MLPDALTSAVEPVEMIILVNRIFAVYQCKGPNIVGWLILRRSCPLIADAVLIHDLNPLYRFG